MYRDPLFLASPNLSDADLLRAAPRIPPYAWRTSQVPGAAARSEPAGRRRDDLWHRHARRRRSALQHFNSAVLSVPGSTSLRRYDKIHRMIFGEYIPLKDYLPFLQDVRAVRWRVSASTAGTGPSPSTTSIGDWLRRFVSRIRCPNLMRDIVVRLDAPAAGNKPVDCLVNVTNDGWFHGSSGLDQHLITALFRCVELPQADGPRGQHGDLGHNRRRRFGRRARCVYHRRRRTRAARRMRDPKTGRWNRQLNAVLVDSVPLDNRSSLYLRHGDWFAAGCGVLAALAGILAVLPAAWPPRRWIREVPA